MLPSELLAQWREHGAPSEVAVDTETSGLWVDAGARVSTVSIAWYSTREQDEHQEITDRYIHTRRNERIGHQDNRHATIESVAWPFDQGVEGTGKPEDHGDMSLFGANNNNLPRNEWVALLNLLQLAGEQRGLVMHNAKFDLHMLRAGTRHWTGRDFEELVDWDTQGVADLTTGMKVPGTKPGSTTTSLKPTTAWLWGERESDEQKVVKQHLSSNRLPAGRWDLMPWEVIRKYADQDARLTIRLYLCQYNELVPALERNGWLDGRNGRMTAWQAVQRRLDTMKMLYRVEKRGVPFDIAGAERDADQIRQRIRELEQRLPFPNTLTSAKNYFFGLGTHSVTGPKSKIYATTDKGQPKMDQQVLDWMVRDRVQWAEEWRDIQKLQTSLSRWYEGWTGRAGRDGRLRPGFRQNGTASGRFSVENIQLQAIPNDYKVRGGALAGLATPRELIGRGVPDGWELWELDLAQAELRVAAHYARCERMLELIRADQDLHGDAAQQLFGVNPGGERWGEMRQVAKRANFSLIFGVGWRKLQADIEEQTGIRLDDGEAQQLVRDWNGLYPEFKRAIREHADRVLSRYIESGDERLGWLGMANGERRWFTRGDIEFYNPELMRNERNAHKAFNQRVQPNLAQYAIDWWLQSEQAIQERLGSESQEVGGVGAVLMVHDSLVLLVPAGEQGRELVEMARRIGLRLWAERFPGLPGGVDASPWLDHA